MIFEEAERFVDVPAQEVWEWVKELENIVSVIPRVEIIEMRDEREGEARGHVLPDFLPFSLPEELNVGEAKTVEVNESEMYTRTVTEGEVFRLETYLECEKVSENETRLYMRAEGELRGTTGTLLEYLLFFSPVTRIVTGTQIDRILSDLGENLKEYMRKYWREELEKKTKELEAFVYTVSHDLRTPLISLEGFSDMLQEEFGAELGEEGLHYLDRIKANVEKMDNFIDDLLELSRVGRKEEENEKVDVQEVVEEVVNDLSSVLEEKGIDVRIQEEMPTLLFQRKRLYQIFSNLISNSCKYMGTPETPKIEIRAESQESNWLLCVEDNGIGIEEENQEKIFEIFHREKRLEEEGTGVGLAIVSQIIENSGGKIWVESEKGKGSKFYIKIPK